MCTAYRRWRLDTCLFCQGPHPLQPHAPGAGFTPRHPTAEPPKPMLSCSVSRLSFGIHAFVMFGLYSLRCVHAGKYIKHTEDEHVLNHTHAHA